MALSSQSIRAAQAIPSVLREISDTMPDSIARGLAMSLDRATYEGYRLGFEAARAEAAALARQAGQGALAAAMEAMQPLPDRRRPRQ
jgi:hypothetical protein